MLCYDHKFVYLLSSPCFTFLQKVLLQSRWSPKQWREWLQRSCLKPVTSPVALYMWFLMAHLIPLASCCILLEVSPLLPLNWLLSFANLIFLSYFCNILQHDWHTLASGQSDHNLEPSANCVMHRTVIITNHP